MWRSRWLGGKKNKEEPVFLRECYVNGILKLCLEKWAVFLFGHELRTDQNLRLILKFSLFIWQFHFINVDWITLMTKIISGFLIVSRQNPHTCQQSRKSQIYSPSHFNNLREESYTKLSAYNASFKEGISLQLTVGLHVIQGSKWRTPVSLNN